MIYNSVVGLIFSNMHDSELGQLTKQRTMGSVPFGSRYRAIDFPLSNMVNSGVSKVGVITKSNFQSLMDHLGSGKAWDLSRKREGLFILPPFGYNNSVYQSRVEALSGIQDFLSHCREEHVIMSDCHIIYTMDYKPALEAHIAKNADITIVYKNSVMPENIPDRITLEIGRGQRVESIAVGERPEDKSNWGINLYIAKKDYLMKVIAGAMARGKLDFERNILQEACASSRVFGYKFTGYTGVISSIDGYYAASMSLMKASVRKDLFQPARPVYTKERDEMPARFGLGSHVVNTSLADGCIIEGDVENCVIFRGVKIGKGAKVKNCILMQDVVVGEGCELKCVIADKDVVIGDGMKASGCEAEPYYIPKGRKVSE